MKFSRPEYWSGWPFPSPGNLTSPGGESRSPRWILYQLSHKGSPITNILISTTADGWDVKLLTLVIGMSGFCKTKGKRTEHEHSFQNHVFFCFFFFLLWEYEFKSLILLCMYIGTEKLNELWIIGFSFLAVGVGIYNKQKKYPRMICVAINLS